MEKDKSYNNLVEYYKTKQDNKKETIAVESSAKGISYNEKVINKDIEHNKIKKSTLNKNLDNKKIERQIENINHYKTDEVNNINKQDENLETEENITHKNLKDGKTKNKKKQSNKKSKDIKKEKNIEETHERNKKISIKKLALNIFTICVIGIVCGYLLGNLIIGKVYMSVNYDKFNEITLRNTDEEIDEWQTKSYNELTPTQIFIVAERKLNTHKYYSIEGVGTIKNSFKNQGVTIKFYKNDNEFYCENRSTGFVNTITAYFYNGENVHAYKGTPKDDGANSWKSKKEYSKEEFKKIYGNDVSQFLYYIVSTKTTIDDELISKNVNIYKYRIKLTNDSSIANYVKQMNYMSGIDSPVFNNVEFEFTVDDNFNLLTLVTHDVYVVNYVALVTCEGSSSLTFTYDEVPEIETEPEVE